MTEVGPRVIRAIFKILLSLYIHLYIMELVLISIIASKSIQNSKSTIIVQGTRMHHFKFGTMTNSPGTCCSAVEATHFQQTPYNKLTSGDGNWLGLGKVL